MSIVIRQVSYLSKSYNQIFGSELGPLLKIFMNKKKMLFTLSTLSTDALTDRSNLTTSWWPLCAAICRGVLPR